MKKELPLPAIIGALAVVLLIVGGVVVGRLMMPPSISTTSKGIAQTAKNPQDLAQKYGYSTGNASGTNAPQAPANLAQKYGYSH